MISIDTDFPGGNITVVSIDGDTVTLRPDNRGGGEWFHWYFRVRGAGTRKLRFIFDVKTNFMLGVVGVLGPAVSLDEGRTWNWLGPAHGPGNSFAYNFTGDGEVRFAVAIPYTRADLDAFLARPEVAHLSRDVICHTPKGRPVELLRLGGPLRAGASAVLLTARHHACESTASFVLEGIMEAALANDEVGQWLRANVTIFVVPMVDVDGVEDGDPGKRRLPHDHVQDYVTQPPRYPEIAAIQSLVTNWPPGALRVAMDLHCPLLSGWTNNEFYFVGNPDAAQWTQVIAFSECLARVRPGILAPDSKYDLPFGRDWNNGSHAAQSAAAWLGKHVREGFAVTVEIPYARMGGEDVSPARARALGQDLAAAMAQYVGRRID